MFEQLVSRGFSGAKRLRALSYPLIRAYRSQGEMILNIPGFFTDADVITYRRLAHALGNAKLILEVGTWEGRSLLNLAAADPGTGTRYIAVDTFRGSDAELGHVAAYRRARRQHNLVYHRFLRNVMRNSTADVSVLRMQSQQAAELFAEGVCDMVFLDGGHSYDDVCADIALWKDKVKPGGYLAGHDYRGRHSDVARAVHSVFSEEAVVLAPPSTIWAVRL